MAGELGGSVLKYMTNHPMLPFSILSILHFLAGQYSPIQDCDEVFNYWEPTHYLNHGSGLQTWEYSPVFAIRSWAYAGLHAVLIWLWKLFPFSSILIKTKSDEFLLLRMTLGMVCAACETKLYLKARQYLGKRVALLFVAIMATSAGMFHASVAYLPSSFAMYCTMLGYAAFMDYGGGLKTAQGIMWFGIGGILGWPFAAALVLPFIAEEVFALALVGGAVAAPADTVRRFLNGVARCLVVLAVAFGIDTFFYRKPVLVPLNIVLYNVFSGAGKGPDIYGTEPWHFYLRNLFINFNFWLLFALASLPLLVVSKFLWRLPLLLNYTRTFWLLQPFYLWMAIMTLQPHKEERFMYPIYPALALNAAVSVHILVEYMSRKKLPLGRVPQPIPSRLIKCGVFALVAFQGTIGILRIAGIATGYSAPLRVYEPLLNGSMQFRDGDTVCLGKEWYRFPSSYFLPEGTRAKFIKSEFSGLLPGEYSEAKVGFGLFPGAWLEPSGMNDMNIEDPGKYVDISQCTFIVDSHSPSTVPTPLEPAYLHDALNWERVKCERFLDAGSTPAFSRIFWAPHRLLPQSQRRAWGEYCLLRRQPRRIAGNQVTPS